MGRQDSNQRKRNRRHDNEWCQKGAEPPDHQQVDQHEDDGERCTQVAEDFNCDLPLAIPFEGWCSVGERQTRVQDI